MAFLAAAAVDPEVADLDRVLRLARTVKRLHVRYKLVVALASMINGGLVPAERVADLRVALDQVAEGADAPLLQIARDTGSLLDALATGEHVD